METTPEEDFVCRQLDSFVPDLLEQRKYQDFIRRLLASEKGKWLRVRDLCMAFPEMDARIQAISPLIKSDLVVVWLDHPADPDYAYIHFYLDDFFWKTSAIFNLTTLEENERWRSSES